MKSKSLSQAREVQNLAYDALMTLSLKRTKEGLVLWTDEDVQKAAQLTKMWEIAAERCRIIRGKPLPGSLRPEKKAKRQLGPMTVLPMDEILPESGNSSVAGGA